MKKFLIKNKNKLIAIATGLIIVISFILGFHNATLYNPSHGFDGEAHVYYINYLFKYKSIPTPGWEISGKYGETHQPPFYYAIGALLMSISGTWKTAQYINIFILWLIIVMVSLGIWRIFRNKELVFIGMFSLAALPMLNIFPAMVSNELLNTFWIISACVGSLYIIEAKSMKQLIFCLIWIAVSLILGTWTKVSIFLAIPTVFTSILVCFINSNKKQLLLTYLIFGFILVSLVSLPVLIRSQSKPNASNVINIVTKGGRFNFGNPYFYYRLDWIPKLDMYTTQYYSLLGGAWNSFWNDGHNAITPFVKFHKKAFILWSLGFVLLPACIYGLIQFSKTKKKYWPSIIVMVTTMLGMYFYMNIGAGHYSAARLTYEMGIVLPYSFGLASAAKNKKIKILLLLLLFIQFVTMVSFYWIQPWWHVTR